MTFRVRLFGRRGTNSRMDSQRPLNPDAKRILFTVRHGRSFPSDLWERFLAIVAARNEKWIDVLRMLIEQYVHRHEQERKP